MTEVNFDAWIKRFLRTHPLYIPSATRRLLNYGCHSARLVPLLVAAQFSRQKPKLSHKDYRTLLKAVTAMTDVMQADKLLVKRVETSQLGSQVFDGIEKDFFEMLLRLHHNLQRAKPLVGKRVAGAQEQAILAVSDYVKKATGEWRDGDVSTVLSAILNQHLSPAALAQRRYRRRSSARD
jgi:hypothetical protein